MRGLALSAAGWVTCASAAAFAAGVDDAKRATVAGAGIDIAALLGAADACAADGGPLLDLYLGSLPHLGFTPAETADLSARMQARRQQSGAEMRTALGGSGACPPEAAGKVATALREMENAWRRAVHNETGVDLDRPAAASPVAERWSDDYVVPSPAPSDGKRWSDGYVVPSPSPSVTPPPPAPFPAAPAAPAPGAELCVPGKAVSVQYGGAWYSGRVLQGPDPMGTCLVAYDGYGSNWDEWVSFKRMRAVSAAAPAPAPAPIPAPASPTPAPDNPGTGTQVGGTIPPGKYSCYTFDGGQLNYTYTDVVIQPGNRYAVGDKGGKYSFNANGGMVFDGPLSNAGGIWSIKNNGVPQIDLIFNRDPRSSMSCSKAR